MGKDINIVLLYTIISIFVLSASSNAIVIKLQDSFSEGDKRFKHVFFQTLVMFIGESLWILLFFYNKYKFWKENNSAEESPEIHNDYNDDLKSKTIALLLIIPMLLDSWGTILFLIAIIHLPASITLMIGCLWVFVVAVMSILFLKRTLYRHHWSGLFLIFIGIWLVSWAILIDEGYNHNGNALFGIIMLVASVFMHALQLIIEEKLLESYSLSPMFVVGVEGVSGTILYVMLLIIFQFIPWTYDIWSNGKLEDTIGALRMIGRNYLLLIFVILNALFVFIYCGLGMLVIKYTSATNRVTVQQVKNVLVWIFFMIYQGKGHETFKWLQLIGFIVIILGVILYNEIVEIPLFGFDQNTRSAISRKQLEEIWKYKNILNGINSSETSLKEDIKLMDYHTFDHYVKNKSNTSDHKAISNKDDSK